MYIERHLQHTRIHIKFCYLIAKTLHSLSDIHIQPPQNTAHAFECRALFSIRGIHRFLHIQRRMSITLHYRERRKHFISYRLYARITTEWKTILFLQVLHDMPFILEAAIDRNHKRNPPIRSFYLARVKTFLHDNT